MSIRSNRSIKLPPLDQRRVQLLFQRLLVVAANKFMDLQDLFKYELCSYPAALFETTFVPRQADKPVLADAL